MYFANSIHNRAAYNPRGKLNRLLDRRNQLPIAG
jgi:hypothetical protein